MRAELITAGVAAEQANAWGVQNAGEFATRGAVEPFLVYRRSGRVVGVVVAAGLGGGTVLMGVLSTAAGAFHARALGAALWGYALAALPLFLLGALLAGCRREFWFVPELGVFRMLTFRPWRLRGPYVEQASLAEYRGVCRQLLGDDVASGAQWVSLVTQAGEAISVREFTEPAAANDYLQRLAEVTGLPTLQPIMIGAQADETAR